jgi:hypothetical protein
MGSRPAANPRYLKSGQLASFFWVVCFLLLTVAFWGYEVNFVHYLEEIQPLTFQRLLRDLDLQVGEVSNVRQ